MQEQIVTMGQDGRVLIPAAYRRKLHFEGGAPVVLTIENGRLQVYSLQEFAKQAQARVKKLSNGRSLTELLKKERGLDVAHE